MAEIVLTEEMRQKLLGVLPFSYDSTHEYTPSMCKVEGVPSDFIPVFMLRGLKRDECNQIKKQLKAATDEQCSEWVRKCLNCWRNLFDAGSGAQILFESDESGLCKKDLFNRLPQIIIEDLLTEILRISGLLDVEKLGLRS